MRGFSRRNVLIGAVHAAGCTIRIIVPYPPGARDSVFISLRMRLWQTEWDCVETVEAIDESESLGTHTLILPLLPNVSLDR